MIFMKMFDKTVHTELFDKMLYMLGHEINSIHFIWNCEENAVFPIRCLFSFNDVSDPFEYFVNNNLIDSSSSFAFRVFRERILSNISESSEDYFESEFVMRFESDGEFCMCLFSVSFFRNEVNAVTDVYFHIKRCNSREVFVKSMADALSSDKNPRIFQKRVMDMMRSNDGKKFAFIQFDVDHFQLINDKYGTVKGDEILTFFSDSLSVICGSNQLFARLTADIFMIVMPCSCKQDVLNFISSIEHYLGEFDDINYRFVFGVAIAEGDNIDIRRMQDNAALARQSVKGNALENVLFYNDDMRKEMQHKKVIEDDMHIALSRDEFAMYLQPKYCISTGKIIGAEALARWIHPEKGMISPVEFIPVFEQNGFILKLDQVIWEKAVKKVRNWIDKGISPVPISVNVSREYLQRFDVVGQILSYIEKCDIPKNLIELEITESVDSMNTKHTIDKMKEAGFVTLMDDFGSGYSSLNMLKQTQFDVLKIDKSFLSEFMTSPRGRKIISHTIAMSNDIGLDIIAEGVETAEEAEFLRDCGCDTAQGFLYSKPVPEEQFDELLKQFL